MENTKDTMKGLSMLLLVASKLLLLALLTASLVASVVGAAHLARILPTTGAAPVAEVKGAIAIEPLEDFVKTVENGDRNVVVGVYVPGVLALPVGQQPQGNAGFVTREPEHATQFGMASQYGTVGILAHNDLAGAEFSNIQPDEYAIVIYGDGRLEYYYINQIQKYQALSPTSTFSDFVNLDGSNERLSASQLFTRIYGTSSRLVFQTCIEANGDASWGRMFIIAEPATNLVMSVFQQSSYLLKFASLGMAR